MYIRIIDWGETPAVENPWEELGVIKQRPKDVVLGFDEVLVDEKKFFLAVIKHGIAFEDITQEVIKRKPYNLRLQKVYKKIYETDYT